MTRTGVYEIRGTLEVKLSELEDAIETGQLELPAEIESIQVKPREGSSVVHVVATASEAAGSIGDYTPVAELKGDIVERTMVENDAGELVREHEVTGSQQWHGEDEEEPETFQLQFVEFKGTEDDVIINSCLRGALFWVLCGIADVAERGMVEAVVVEEGALRPIRVEAGGERIPVTLSLERDVEEEDEEGVSWRQNPFISE